MNLKCFLFYYLLVMVTMIIFRLLEFEMVIGLLVMFLVELELTSWTVLERTRGHP